MQSSRASKGDFSRFSLSRVLRIVLAVRKAICQGMAGAQSNNERIKGINVSFPERRRLFVEAPAAARYGTVSGYIRELLREDRKRKSAAQPKQLFLEGLDSGLGEGMSSEFFQEPKKEFVARAGNGSGTRALRRYCSQRRRRRWAIRSFILPNAENIGHNLRKWSGYYDLYSSRPGLASIHLERRATHRHFGRHSASAGSTYWTNGVPRIALSRSGESHGAHR